MSLQDRLESLENRVSELENQVGIDRPETPLHKAMNALRLIRDGAASLKASKEIADTAMKEIYDHDL